MQKHSINLPLLSETIEKITKTLSILKDENSQLMSQNVTLSLVGARLILLQDKLRSCVRQGISKSAHVVKS